MIDKEAIDKCDTLEKRVEFIKRCEVKDLLEYVEYSEDMKTACEIVYVDGFAIESREPPTKTNTGKVNLFRSISKFEKFVNSKPNCFISFYFRVTNVSKSFKTEPVYLDFKKLAVISLEFVNFKYEQSTKFYLPVYSCVFENCFGVSCVADDFMFRKTDVPLNEPLAELTHICFKRCFLDSSFTNELFNQFRFKVTFESCNFGLVKRLDCDNCCITLKWCNISLINFVRLFCGPKINNKFALHENSFDLNYEVLVKLEITDGRNFTYKKGDIFITFSHSTYGTLVGQNIEKFVRIYHPEILFDPEAIKQAAIKQAEIIQSKRLAVKRKRHQKEDSDDDSESDQDSDQESDTGKKSPVRPKKVQKTVQETQNISEDQELIDFLATVPEIGPKMSLDERLQLLKRSMTIFKHIPSEHLNTSSSRNNSDANKAFIDLYGLLANFGFDICDGMMYSYKYIEENPILLRRNSSIQPREVQQTVSSPIDDNIPIQAVEMENVPEEQ